MWHQLAMKTNKTVDAIFFSLLGMDDHVKDDRAFSLLHQELPQILVLCSP